MRKLRIVISSVWLVIAFTLTSWALSFRQYGFIGENIIPFLLPLILPVAALIFSVLYKGKRKIPGNIFTVIFGIFLLLNIAYVAKDMYNAISLAKTDENFSFTDFFPEYRNQFSSKTEDIENYLDIEDFTENEKISVFRYFPEVIPEEAELPQYRLYWNTFFFETKMIDASWTLNEKAFNKEIERISKLSDIDGNKPKITEEDGVKRFYFAGDYVEVTFDTASKTVEYCYNHDD